MIKIKEGFVLRDIAGQKVAVATGKVTKDFHGMIKLNSTGAFIAENMLQDTSTEELVALLRKEYDVDEETAVESVESIVEKFQSVGLIRE